MFLTSRHRPFLAIVATTVLVAGLVPLGSASGDSLPDHLVVSEVVTGGSSASDELIEVHNPTATALPLEGLEIVYVTSSGATIGRRAAWALGAPPVPPGGHVLVANEAGVYAPIADVTYASGIASTGGSVAIRIQGAATAIDAVGWGTAGSSWIEGTPAAAPPADGSLERRPGGPLGSSVDTDDNAADFVTREVPDPQNLASPPTPGSAGPTPSSASTGEPEPTVPPPPTPTAAATPSPTAAPTEAPSTIATARGLPDGSAVTIEGVAVAGSDFTDGGGAVVDASAGIAVLVDGVAFARGDRLRLHGTVDDRYSQRTLRVAATGLDVIGTGADPAPLVVPTAAIGEETEGRLVRISGTILGAPTALSAGLAFDVDDGSGAVRVLVGTSTGIATADWGPGAQLTTVGVAGQRDSSGSGTSGYRILPRDATDVLAIRPASPPTPTPNTSSSPGASSSADPSGVPNGVATIADVRQLPKNARVRVRGTVTMPTGVVDEATAVIQDATGAIVLRLGDEAGRLALGATVEVDGTRSTKGGMETLRVTVAPRTVPTAAAPAPRLTRTGDAGEPLEARLVTVRGTLSASARRASTGSVSFEVDDGSGPLRIAVPAAVDLDDDPFVAGAWVEVTGILGQETTGAQPQRGYRVWPRAADDLRLTAATGNGEIVGGSDGESHGGPGGSSGSAGTPLHGLDALDGGGLADGPVGATLVAGPWPELGVGAILWDGERVMGVAASDGPRVAALVASYPLPVALALGDLTPAGRVTYGLPVVRLGPDADDVTIAEGGPVPPSTSLPGDAGAPRWVSLVGRHVATPDGHRLLVDRAAGFALERRCEDGPPWPPGVIAVRGLAAPAAEADVVVPCGGVVRSPVLGRGAAAGTDGAAPAGAGSHDSAAPRGRRGRPVPAAILLAAGALGLAGSAATAWRRRDAESVPPDPDEDASAAPKEGMGPDEAVGPPVLTLVPLPRERAP